MNKPTPKQTVEKWIAAFNNADVDALANLYAEDAITHHKPNQRLIGRPAIGEMLKEEFAAAPKIHRNPIQIMEDGDWAVVKWCDAKGFRSCGFFEIKDGLIRTQRGYWDRLTFNKLYDISVYTK